MTGAELGPIIEQGSNFLVGLFTNFLTEYIARLDRRAEQARRDTHDWGERSKTLKTRILHQLSLAASHCSLKPAESESFRALLSDQVFAAEIVDAFLSQQLTAEQMTERIIAQDSSVEKHRDAITELARSLCEAIHAAVASDLELSTLIVLKQGADTNREVRNVSETLKGIHHDVQELSVSMSETRDIARVEQKVDLIFQQLAPIISQITPLKCELSATTKLQKRNKKDFDAARHELLNGSVDQAKSAFQRLIIELEDGGPDVDRELLFRSVSNLGLCEHYLGNDAEAIGCFERAYNLNRQSIRAKANWALACILRQDYDRAEEAVADALKTEPADVDANMLAVQLRLIRKDVDAALAFLEAHALQSDRYFTALSDCYCQKREYGKAADAARRALELDRQSVGGRIALANALAIPIVTRHSADKVPSYGIPIADVAVVKEAANLMREAINRLRVSGRQKEVGELLVNYSAFTAEAGNFQESLSASEEASSIRPHDSAPLANLYTCQMRLERYGEAAATARKLREIEAPVIAVQREMNALMAADQVRETIQLFDQESKKHPALLNEPHALCLKARALFALPDTNAAITLLEDVASRYPRHPLVLMEQGRVHEERNRIREARDCYIQAERNATGPFEFRAKQQLGLFYYRQRKWNKAASRLVVQGQDPLRSPFLTKYLTCLYELERYPECLDIAVRFISGGTYERAIYELAINCHVKFHDLVAAEKLLETLVRKSNDLYHWLTLFEVTFRLRDTGQALKVLERAYDKHPESYQVLVNLSGLKFAEQDAKASLAFGLKALEKKPDGIEAHHAVARAGLMSSDSVAFSETEKEAVCKSARYLAATPGSGLQMVPIEPDFDTIRKMMKEFSEAAGRAEKLYEEKQLPMAFLSKVVGRSPFKIWTGLLNHPRLQVHMAHGSAEEQEQEGQLAFSADTISADSSALFTLQLLGLLDLLPKAYKAVHVATAVFESIKADYNELTMIKEPKSVLGYAAGELILTDISPEVHVKQREFLAAILKVLDSPTVKLSGISGSTWADKTVRKSVDTLGETAYHPIAIAKALSIPCYSDDAGMRDLGRNIHGVGSFCTQAFLRMVEAKGFVSGGQYEDALLTLFGCNYGFISESPRTIIHLLTKEKYVIGDLSKKLLRRVTDPAINRSRCASILGEVVGHIWVHCSGFENTREDWLALIAHTLSSVDKSSEILVAFLSGVALRLLTTPSAFYGVCDFLERTPALVVDHRVAIRRASIMIGRDMAGLVQRVYPGFQGASTEWKKHSRVRKILSRAAPLI